MPLSAQDVQSRRWIILLLAALAAWGLYHAIGAFLFNHDVRRGLIVLACMAVFLGWWMLLLRYRTKTRNVRSRAAGADDGLF